MELVLHLAHRQLQATHRFTLFGWLWPVIRQVAQLAVLVFLFSSVLDLGIADFPVFVFTGLVLWAWFSGAVSVATQSLISERHLVFSPRLPTIVLPLVAVAVSFVDVLLALPVLLAMLVLEGELHATIALLPLLLVLQFLLTAGVALLASSLNVYFRDVQNVVAVGLLLMFYLTPVFYGLKQVPERFQGLLHVNPLTPLLDSARALVLEGRLPTAGDLAVVAGAGLVMLVLGGWVFTRLEPGFVDEL